MLVAQPDAPLAVLESAPTPQFESTPSLVEQAYTTERISYEATLTAQAEAVLAAHEEQPGESLKLDFGSFGEAFPPTSDMIAAAYASPHRAELLSEEDAPIRLIVPHEAVVATYPLLAEIHTGRTLEYSLRFTINEEGGHDLTEAHLLIDWDHSVQRVESSSSTETTETHLDSSEQPAVTSTEAGGMVGSDANTSKEDISFTSTDTFTVEVDPNNPESYIFRNAKGEILEAQATTTVDGEIREVSDHDREAIEILKQYMLNVLQDGESQTYATAIEFQGAYYLSENIISLNEAGQLVKVYRSTEISAESLQEKMANGEIDHTTNSEGTQIFFKDKKEEPDQAENPYESSSTIEEQMFHTIDQKRETPTLNPTFEYIGQKEAATVVPGSVKSFIVMKHSTTNATSWWEEFTQAKPKTPAKPNLNQPTQPQRPAAQPHVMVQAVVKNTGPVPLDASRVRLVVSLPPKPESQRGLDRQTPPEEPRIITTAYPPAAIDPQAQDILSAAIPVHVLEAIVKKEVNNPDDIPPEGPLTSHLHIAVHQDTTAVHTEHQEIMLPEKELITQEITFNETTPIAETVTFASTTERKNTAVTYEEKATITAEEVVHQAPAAVEETIQLYSTDDASHEVQSEVEKEIKENQELQEAVAQPGHAAFEEEVSQKKPVEQAADTWTSTTHFSTSDKQERRASSGSRSTSSTTTQQAQSDDATPADDTAQTPATTPQDIQDVQENEASETTQVNGKKLRKVTLKQVQEQVLRAEVNTEDTIQVERSIFLKGTRELNARQLSLVSLQSKLFASEQRQKIGKPQAIINMSVERHGDELILRSPYGTMAVAV